ncbi:MAG: hypothetical protein KTR16_08910 [Acidiferrobacterales bacterium]|nr:hypothetical protein [Acidiferrobacterales bacterium]
MSNKRAFFAIFSAYCCFLQVICNAAGFVPTIKRWLKTAKRCAFLNDALFIVQMKESAPNTPHLLDSVITLPSLSVKSFIFFQRGIILLVCKIYGLGIPS